MARDLGLHFLSLLTLAAARSGSDLRAVMASLQLGVHTGEARPPMLPLSLLVSLLEQLEARAHHGRFVFALAEVFNLDDRPAVSAFVNSAGSLRQLLRLLAWVPDMVHPQFHFRVSESQGRMHLQPSVRAEDARLVDHPLLIELLAAVVLRMARAVSPEVVLADQIHFRHAAMGSMADYERCFGCAVSFGADDNRIEGDSRLFDRPLPGSLPQANASAEQTIRVQILGDGLAPPLVLEAERLLLTRLSLFGEGLPGLAAALQCQPRTLQRQLRAAGTSYARLVSGLRDRLATDMLRDPALDIETIALKLGYAERRSFTLAFRQARGCTPSAWRKAQRVMP